MQSESLRQPQHLRQPRQANSPVKPLSVGYKRSSDSFEGRAFWKHLALTFETLGPGWAILNPCFLADTQQTFGSSPGRSCNSRALPHRGHRVQRSASRVSIMFGKLFGKHKEAGGQIGPRPASNFGGGGGSNQNSGARTVEAIQKLGETEELLMKRRTLLEKKCAQEAERAREQMKAKNKRGALMSLKKKKMFEMQLEQVENNIFRLNEQQNMLEGQRTTVETLVSMQNASRVSKQQMQEMKVDDVDKVLDEINDQNDQLQQINTAMQTPIGDAANMDEDELTRELEEMEAEELDEQLLQPAPAPTRIAPSKAQPQATAAAPSRAQPQAAAPARKQKTPEEMELEALEAEMAL
ncbi:hypothetical protein WJX74_000017 [Apatococcus lobatus]|uniref:Uncharacterized protein n=1 Tax=Apatococcus lobatus TaxID=904363 RepID=A0AAW1RGH0_9CHLO